MKIAMVLATQVPGTTAGKLCGAAIVASLSLILSAACCPYSGEGVVLCGKRLGFETEDVIDVVAKFGVCVASWPAYLLVCSVISDPTANWVVIPTILLSLLCVVGLQKW